MQKEKNYVSIKFNWIKSIITHINSIAHWNYLNYSWSKKYAIVFTKKNHLDPESVLTAWSIQYAVSTRLYKQVFSNQIWKDIQDWIYVNKKNAQWSSISFEYWINIYIWRFKSITQLSLHKLHQRWEICAIEFTLKQKKNAHRSSISFDCWITI